MDFKLVHELKKYLPTPLRLVRGARSTPPRLLHPERNPSGSTSTALSGERSMDFKGGYRHGCTAHAGGFSLGETGPPS